MTTEIQKYDPKTESEDTGLVQVSSVDTAIQHAMTADQIIAQVNLIQDIMKKVMKDGEHYGVIPGTDKPSLLKSGAEKICMTFRLRPEYLITERDLPNGHREYESMCDLFDIQTGNKVGAGVGVCSTMESKYRYRKSALLCPHCGGEHVIKGKEEYGGGWLCWAKKGGCGAKFKDEDEKIKGQKVGRIENPDIADTYNTVKKISKKRSFVDATLTATAASDIFTQDMEELARIVPATGGSPGSLPPIDTVNSDDDMPFRDDETPLSRLELFMQKEFHGKREQGKKMLIKAFGTYAWSKIKKLDDEALAEGYNKIKDMLDGVSVESEAVEESGSTKSEGEKPVGVAKHPHAQDPDILKILNKYCNKKEHTVEDVDYILGEVLYPPKDPAAINGNLAKDEFSVVIHKIRDWYVGKELET